MRNTNERQFSSGYLDERQDAELSRELVRAQDGDREAYERFLKKSSEVLRAYLYRHLNDKDMAEDVLQESLIAIHKARHTYIRGRAVGAWLFTIAKHKMIDFLRKIKRLNEREVNVPDYYDWSQAKDSRRPESDLAITIREVLEQLPEKQRMIIKLLKLENKSVIDVAQQTGMSESAVKVTAFRGYEAIRRTLGVKKDEN